MISPGGFCITINEKYQPWVKKIIIKDRAKYVIFNDNTNNLQRGTLNVYASNHVLASPSFWQDILQGLPMVDNWCVTGDFNMLEDPVDRCGSMVTILG